MDFQTIRHYYNRCNPYESLEPADDRNVDFDRLGTRERPVRGIVWVERIKRKILLSEGPSCILFTGLTGSGKSTELRRLASFFKDHNEPSNRFLPVFVEAEEFIDLHNPIDVPEILMAIVYQTDVVVANLRESKKPMADSYFERLWNWLTRTDVELTKAEFSIGAPAKLVAEMKTRPALRSRVRDAIAASLNTFLADVHTELGRLQKEAMSASGAGGIVVILDSLEKLRGVSTNWHQVLSSAEQIFTGGAPYLQLPVHVIYTFPAALVSRAVLPNAMFLPMLKLNDPTGQSYEEGLAAARELITKRIPDPILKDVLGDAWQRRINELILWSGGYPREIVRMLQSILLLEEFPISADDFSRVRNEIWSSINRVVPPEAYDWLADISIKKEYTLRTAVDEREMADNMFANNVILRYLNNQEWFDLHPAAKAIPGVQEAIRKRDPLVV